jgi:hypothetical protein
MIVGVGGGSFLAGVVPLGLEEVLLVVGAIAAIMWASRCEREAEVDVMVELFRMGIGLEGERFCGFEGARRFGLWRLCLPVCVASDF